MLYSYSIYFYRTKNINMLLHQVFYILLFILLVFLYILACLYTKPFLINRKRKYSTLSLKITYLIYLAFLFLFLFFFLIFGADKIEYQMSDALFFAILTFLFLPNIGILLRRSIKKIRARVVYNIIFTTVNLLAVYFIIHKLVENKWFI